MANHKNEGMDRFFDVITSGALESFMDVWNHMWGCESAMHMIHDPWLSFAHLLVVIAFYGLIINIGINVFRELCHFGFCFCSREYPQLIKLDKAYSEMILGLRSSGELLDDKFVASIVSALPNIPSMRRKPTQAEETAERLRKWLSKLNPEELAEITYDDFDNMLDEVKLRIAQR